MHFYPFYTKAYLPKTKENLEYNRAEGKNQGCTAEFRNNKLFLHNLFILISKHFKKKSKYNLNLTDMDTEAQKDEGTCPRSHNKSVEETEIKPSSPDSQSSALITLPLSLTDILYTHTHTHLLSKYKKLDFAKKW